MIDLEGIYLRLPYPLKVVAASLQGARLNRSRYGPETEEIAQRAEMMENRTLEEILQWQQSETRVFLQEAATAVPHYRALWKKTRAGDPSVDPGDLHVWPVLAKEEVRRNPEELMARNPKGVGTRTFATSGSTGTPLKLAASVADLRMWYGLTEARWRRWYGVSRRDRWAMVGGQLVTRRGRTKPPYWVWNAAMKQLYLSAHHLGASTAEAYVEAMAGHEVSYMLGYPSAMAELATGMLEKGVEPPALKVVVSNAEPLLPRQRRVLEEAFKCPVRDTYGMAEMVAAASECEHGRMHLWPEAGVVEVLDDEDRPVDTGEIGRLVCTTLVNRTMPLVRYDTGDRGALAPDDEQCPCGRSLPVLARVEGRLDDVVMARDGRRIGRLDTVFKTDLPIRAAQIIQQEDGDLAVKVVWDGNPDRYASAEIAARIRERVGPIGIRIEAVEVIQRGPGGKFRGVISALAREAAE